MCEREWKKEWMKGMEKEYLIHSAKWIAE